MFSTVAIVLEALPKNVREVSHELMEGNLTCRPDPKKSPATSFFFYLSPGWIY